MDNKRIFLFIIAFYFLLSAVFHFIRLSFGWDVLVGGNYVPTWVSALCVLFSIFMVYWVLRIKEEGKKRVDVKRGEE